MTSPAAPLSLRAYAKHRGCSAMAVSRAVAAGRLEKSVGRNAKGDPVIIDAELADREWAGTTKDRHVPIAFQEKRAPAERPPSPPPGDEDLEDGAIPPRTVSAARREAAEARLAELKLALEEGRVVPAQDVESRLVNTFAQCKTKLLGVPSRARQRDPALTSAQIDLLEGLLREALEELAGGPAAPPEERRKAKRKRAPAEAVA